MFYDAMKNVAFKLPFVYLWWKHYEEAFVTFDLLQSGHTFIPEILFLGQWYLFFYKMESPQPREILLDFSCRKVTFLIEGWC